jgi:hypothetical protein
MVPRNLHRRLLIGIGAALVACGGEPAADAPSRADALSATEQAALRAESLRAAAVAARPSTGRWDLDRVSERLLRAGVNPRANDTLPELPGFVGSPEVGRFRIGRSMDLLVLLYADSTQRSAVSAGLDSATVAPPGMVSPWGLDPLMITSVNLLAVLSGGSSAQRERVQLALEAGLPPAAEGAR